MAPRVPRTLLRLQYASPFLIGFVFLMVSLREDRSRIASVLHKSAWNLAVTQMPPRFQDDDDTLQQNLEVGEGVEEQEDDTESEEPAKPVQTRQQPLLEFVHIPKTGGTTIAKLAAAHGVAWSQCRFTAALEKGRTCPPERQYGFYYAYRRKTPKQKAWPPFWHIPPRYFQNIGATELPTQVNPYPPETPLFAVVRNPYTRMVSEWYFLTQANQHSGPEKYNNATEFNLFLRQKMRTMLRLKPGGGANGMTRSNPYWMHDAHFVPQYDYIYSDKGAQVVKHVLKFENLAEDFSKLMQEYGLDDLKLIEGNKKSQAAEDMQLSVRNITDGNKALIHKIYRLDFERFGYEIDEPTQREQPRLQFVHIPKTGGTSIAKVAAKHGIAWSQCLYDIEIDRDQECPPNQQDVMYSTYRQKLALAKQWPPFWHVPPKHFQNGNVSALPTTVNPYPPETPLFAVVRHPYDRIVSEWYFQTQANQKQKPEMCNNATELNMFLAKKLRILAWIRRGGGMNGMTRSNPYWMHDAHFVPQYDYIYKSKNTQVVQHILKFENLAEDFAKLMTLFRLDDLKLGKSNTAKNQQLSAQDITDANKALIHKIYRRDFESFGYEMDDLPPKQEEVKQPQLQFVHIPKTGGTAITTLAAAHDIAWARCHYAFETGIGQECPSNQQYAFYTAYRYERSASKQWAPFWHVPPRYILNQKAAALPTTVNPYPPTATLFAVVRNPYTRIISEWYSLKQANLTKQDSGPRKYNNATQFNTFLFQKLTTLTGIRAGGGANGMTRVNLYWMHDAHFVPQYDFIYNRMGIQVVKHVLKFENLDEDFAKLMAEYGLDDLRLDGERKEINAAKDRQLGTKDITDANKALIHKIYRRDFESFGYEMDQLDERLEREQPQLQFVHIPKTGGTSIEYMAAEHGIAWSRCHYDIEMEDGRYCPPNQLYGLCVYSKEYKPKTPATKRWAPFWHVPPRYFQNKDLAQLPTHVNPFPPTTPLFAVVRNPYTRIVSEWYFTAQIKDKYGPAVYNNAANFNKFLKPTLSTMSRLKPGGGANGMVVLRNNYWIYDAHFVPQYDYIYNDDGTQVVQHVLKFENLAEDFAKLMTEYGLTDLSLEDNRNRGNTAKNQQLSVLNITDANKALIHKIYGRDFESFGYEMI